MKSLLVDLGQFNAHAYSDPFFSWHNHGAGLVVASCRATGHSIDFTGLKYLTDWEAFKQKIKGYDLVGFSCLSTDLPKLKQAVRIVKELNPKTITIVGGMQVTVGTQSLLDNPDIDYIFHGEAEITFPKFLEDPSKFDREIHGEPTSNLDLIPWIDRMIYPMPLERNVQMWGESPIFTVLTARGCPFNCSFCQPAEKKHFGAMVRRRSVENVIGEIKEYLKFKPKFIIFHDDHFCFNKQWLEDFIEAYRPISLPFWAATRADFVCQYPEMFTKLKEVGMEVCSIGFESGSQRILDMVRKGTTVEQNYQSASIIGKTGMQIYANIMYGFPTENKEEQMATRKLCNHISSVSKALISPAFFTPYPGNDLGDDCIAQGLSMVDEDHLNRYGKDKIKGVDYEFLSGLVAGLYDNLIK